MQHRTPLSFALILTGTIFAASTLTLAPAFAVLLDSSPSCAGLPSYNELTQVLRTVVAVGDPSVNSGLANHMGNCGQSPCTDHIIAWKMRDAFGLDNVPFGFSPTGDDNIIHDIVTDPVTGLMSSPSGFGHPACDSLATAIARDLPACYPMGPGQGPVAGAAESYP